MKKSISVFMLCFTVSHYTSVEAAGKFLSLPQPQLCASRKIHQTYDNHGYYFSWRERETINLFLNWIDARNWCRDRCMDLISLETPTEIKLLKSFIQNYKVKYCWTSGRLCDFGDSCKRKDLEPVNINGWFWSGTNVKLHPTNEKSEYNDWSYTGALKEPQPDQREKREGGYAESCLAYLNNYYDDGIKWHDVGCHHIKSFACEDSPTLLEYARFINKNSTLVF